MSRIVLAYSGGLDTSVILDWLVRQGHETHAVYVDVGQRCEDKDAILRKAEEIGAASARIMEAGEQLCSDFAFPLLQWDARYEGMYLLGTALSRPLITKLCLRVACDVQADTFAHGATGKGNDQCRFELAAAALHPTLTVFAPWRQASFREQFPGRQEMLRYCREQNIPVTVTAEKPYSSDESCLHVSYEAGQLEDLAVYGIERVQFGMTRKPIHAKDKEEQVSIAFESGMPVAVDGVRMSPCTIVQHLNVIGGHSGIGLTDMVENRFVGMKSRGVYEAPGMTILYAAHRYLEQITLDRDLLHLRDRLSPEVAELVYNGFWYTRKMDACLAFIRKVQEPVTGEVTLSLYKGNVTVMKRSSPHSLYDAGLATMEKGGAYNQDDAEGFLQIQGLPSRVQAGITPRMT